MENITIDDNCVSFSKEFFAKITTECSPGAIFVLLKAIDLYINTNNLPKTPALRRACGFSEPTFKLYLNEIRKLGFVNIQAVSNTEGGYTQILSFFPKEERVSTNMKLGAGEVVLNTVGDKISQTKQRINTKIRTMILEPYIAELIKRGMGGLIYKDFRTKLFRELVHVVSQYKESLSPNDILSIMISALDNKYLQSIGRTTSMNLIFFNKTTSLVERYIAENKVRKTVGKYSIPANAFVVVNNSGEEQNPEEYGYFVKIFDTFTHVAPKNVDAMFFKISREAENRVQEKPRDKTLDYLFDNNILKEEETWRVGSLGRNNKFIGK